MTDVSWPVAVVLGAVFVVFGLALGGMGRDIEPWARRFLWAKGLMWSLFGLGIAVGHWLPGVGAALMAAAVVSRLTLVFRRRSRSLLEE